jgi:hypothetical protein
VNTFGLHATVRIQDYFKSMEVLDEGDDQGHPGQRLYYVFEQDPGAVNRIDDLPTSENKSDLEKFDSYYEIQNANTS